MPNPNAITIERPSNDVNDRPAYRSMKRGFLEKCPACGEGKMFRAYLKVADQCPKCGEALHHHRADDAPPYFTMLVTGHVIVGGILVLEKYAEPASWVHAAIWCPLLIIISLWLLPRVKGALVGLQWALRMHGFGIDIIDGRDIAAVSPLPEPERAGA